MTELTIGAALKQSYDFLSDIYSDTAKLLTIVEDYMKSKNFVSLWGAPAFWDRSQAYYGDYGWLCHYFSRVYVPKNPNDKNPRLSDNICAFINIYLVPKQVEQPIIVFGIAKVNQEEIFKSWKETMCVNYGPEFANTDNLDSWEAMAIEGDSDLQQLVFKIRPLVEVNDKFKTKTLCDEVINKFWAIRA